MNVYEDNICLWLAMVPDNYIQDVNTITKLLNIYINNANNTMFTLLNCLISKQ